VPFVFGYGSLVDRASVQASIGRVLQPTDGPHPVRLTGYRRAWNVAAHSSHRPDYTFARADGTPWEGWVAFVGIEPAPSETTLGAVCRLAEDELVLLDFRERSYDRIDVRGRLDREPPGVDGPVYAYLPKPDAVAEAGRAGTAGTVAARYLRQVDRGYRALGEELYAEHVGTFPDPAPFAVEEISVTRPVAPVHGR